MLDDGFDDSDNLQRNCGHHLRDVPAGTEQSAGGHPLRPGPPAQGALARESADLGLRAAFSWKEEVHLSGGPLPPHRMETATEVPLTGDV